MRSLFLLFFLVLATPLRAQVYKKLRLQVGFGLAKAEPNYNSSTGPGILLIHLEPSYRITQRIALCIRLEAGGNLVGGSYAVASYGIAGQYYFSDKKFRPFCGLGLSNYHPMLRGDAFYSYGSRNEKWVVGFYPRIGFDFGHLTVLTEYNLMSSSEALISYPAQLQLPSIIGSINGNYFALKIGVNMGGGRKK